MDIINLTCLQVHNDYQIPGGETKTARGIADLLEENGIRVIRYYKTNDSFKTGGNLQKLTVGLKSLYNKNTVNEVQDILGNNKVDFALIHNVMPIVSNSIYNVLIDNEIPIIKYIQNYNLICLNGGLDHNEECERCKNNNVIGICHRCYKGSLLFTVIKYIAKKNLDKKYLSHIAAFMPNSCFVRDRHAEFGMDTSKMHVMYNYIEAEGISISQVNYRSYYLYFGRISKEKGVFTAVEAFKKLSQIKLVIMGSGESEDELRGCIKGYQNIEYIGPRSGDKLKEVISRAKVVIVPSEWDEPLPRTILEAFSFGIPVIGARSGGITEMIRDGLGYLYQAGDASCLTESIRFMESLTNNEYNNIRMNSIKECTEVYSKEGYMNRFQVVLDELLGRTDK